VQKPIEAEEVMLKAKVDRNHQEMHANYSSRRICAKLVLKVICMGAINCAD
jgi:hypothetical protein